MKQESKTNIKDDDSKNQIEYSCFYKQCKFCRCLCQLCKLDVNHLHKTHIANQDDYFQQQQIIKQSIRIAKFVLFDQGKYLKGLVGAISNDLKYVAIGDSDQDLLIWDHSNNNLIKTIQFNTRVSVRVLQVKFTNDSKILYVLTIENKFYKYNVKNQFKQLQTYQFRQQQNFDPIRNIYNISNEILLTSTYVGYIQKINVQQNKQLLKINSHEGITCLDYNKSLNIIVTGSYKKSISFWNANDGQLLFIESLAHGSIICKVLFMINDQLISSDEDNLVIIWNIDYATKRLHKLQTLDTFHHKILHQQFIISTSPQSVKIHSIDGEFLREFDHNLQGCIKYYNNLFFQLAGYKIIQPDSIESCLIFGIYGIKQLVFKIKFD